MKYRMIFPAAAGVIALTAAVSFAIDQKESEEDEFCRTLIEKRCSAVKLNEITNKRLPASEGGGSGNVYHVNITRGNKMWLVSIDAYTGKVRYVSKLCKYVLAEAVC